MKRKYKPRGLFFVSSFTDHGFFISRDGNLFGFGCNDHGELGIGKITEISEGGKKPIHVKGFKRRQITTIVLETGYTIIFNKVQEQLLISGEEVFLNGSHHTLYKKMSFGLHPQVNKETFRKKIENVFTSGNGLFILTECTSKNTYALGMNNRGCLGIGILPSSRELVSVAIEEKILKCSAGTFVSFYIGASGKVYGSGRGKFLGKEDNENYNIPIVVPVPKCRDISCGYDHTLFLTVTGNVYSQGDGWDGRLGLFEDDDPETDNHGIPMQIIKGLSEGGTISAQAGGFHSIFLSYDEKRKKVGVKSCGWNSFCQLGHGGDHQYFPKFVPGVELSRITEIVDVYAQNGSSFFLKSDGTIFGFGKQNELFCDDPETFAEKENENEGEEKIGSKNEVYLLNVLKEHKIYVEGIFDENKKERIDFFVEKFPLDRKLYIFTIL